MFSSVDCAANTINKSTFPQYNFWFFLSVTAGIKSNLLLLSSLLLLLLLLLLLF